MKKCPICTGEFTPRKMGQKTCSPICQREFDRQRKLLKARKESLKTRQEWLKDAERECNKYIRVRDRDRPCISCGATGRDMHAGHMRSVGSSQALRYYEFNIFAQCSKCNTHLSGNLLGYRIGLAEREGIEHVEYLENHRVQAKWTIDELKEIKEYYRGKWKELLCEY